MTRVRANRTVTLTSEQERRATPISANANRIATGKSDGWSLIYCKGPAGNATTCGVQGLGKSVLPKRARSSVSEGSSANVC